MHHARVGEGKNALKNSFPNTFSLFWFMKYVKAKIMFQLVTTSVLLCNIAKSWSSWFEGNELVILEKIVVWGKRKFDLKLPE
jgi:hypothetical protein